jgi:hypothetical protein
MTTDEFINDLYLPLVNKAYDQDELSQEHYDLLRELPAETSDEQARAYKELEYYILLGRIRKGAAYIETINDQHPHWIKAHKRIDELSEMVRKIRLEEGA